MKARKTAIAATLATALFLTVAQAPAANATWGFATNSFTATDYAGDTRIGSLTASGYACRISVPKQGYKVKAYLKVYKSSIVSPASKPVRAIVRAGTASAVGPYVAASVGNTSTTPYLSTYLGANDRFTFSLISGELRTNGTVSIIVDHLPFC